MEIPILSVKKIFTVRSIFATRFPKILLISPTCILFFDDDLHKTIANSFFDDDPNLSDIPKFDESSHTWYNSNMRPTMDDLDGAEIESYFDQISKKHGMYGSVELFFWFVTTFYLHLKQYKA